MTKSTSERSTRQADSRSGELTPGLNEVVQELKVMTRLLALIAVRDMEQREAITTLTALGLSPAQIGQAVGVTPNAVRIALHRARRATRSAEGDDATSQE